MAKTTKKTTKPVTMAALHKRLKAVEATCRRQDGLIAAHASNVMDKLDRIESKVSDDAAFRLFVQSLVKERNEQQVTGAPVNIRVTIPEEQGLEPGDYTDASKEVADELTAMGYQWKSGDRTEWNHIGWNGEVIDNDGYPPRATRYKQIDQAEFLSRARVTAKRLGLVPVEQPKPWKPEVGELVVVTGGWQLAELRGKVVRMVIKSPLEGSTSAWVDGSETNYSCGLSFGDYEDYCNSIRPATPEEVAKYHADQEAAVEAAKPIVPYVTKVKHEGMEWRAVSLVDSDGEYFLHRTNEDGDSQTTWAKRHEFKVID